tara:strand:+ start:13161 stop:14372 length:1212 start_codon:yes stop_codon:yes gene_type:complete
VSSKYLPEYSGSGNRAHNTYKRLEKKFGIEFEVLCASIEFKKSEKYQYDGVAVKRIASNSVVSLFLNNGTRLSQLFLPLLMRLDYTLNALLTFIFLWRSRKRFDYLHVFGNVPVTSVAISYAKIFKIPILIEFTSDRSSPHSYEPLVIKKMWGAHLPVKSTIVCISPKLASMCDRYGYSKQVWCRPNPFDESVFFPEPEQKYNYRSKLTKYTKDDLVISSVAKFTPRKNQIFLLDVLKLLPDHYKLVLAGPLVNKGPLADLDQRYFHDIESLVIEYNLSHRVEIIPEFIDRPEAYIKLSDVFVFPSVSEGLGTPVLEAIACGIPVVASDIKGVTDAWIKEEENGYLSSNVPKEFSLKVIEAAKITQDSLKDSSVQINKSASTEVIDIEYRNHIARLVELEQAV